jgi:hypothetical protein
MSLIFVAAYTQFHRGINVFRHDRACKSIVAKISALRSHGQIEFNPTLHFRNRNDNSLRPADVVISNPHGTGRRILVDVTIVDDTQCSSVIKSTFAKTPVKALQDKYAEKLTKYAEIVASGEVEFWPICFTVRGQIHEESRKHLQSLFATVRPRFGSDRTTLFHALLDNIVFDIAWGAVAQVKKHNEVENAFRSRPAQRS